MKIKNYTTDFNDVLVYCEKNRLFVGEGNPNSKILIIGKEIGGETPKSLAEIEVNSEKCTMGNIQRWVTHEGYDLSAVKSSVLKADLEKLKRRNPTWTSYQKVVSRIIDRDLGQDNFDFLDHCFMTEMSDVHLPDSNHHRRFFPADERQQVDKKRKASVKKRAEELFTLPFFQRFPIVIIACGASYQRQFDAEHNICSTWNVVWSGKPADVLSGKGKLGNFYNDHRGKTTDGFDKIVIHTRQMS